ncbi:unnamed protein product [Moneuplotes crassus]|uniref:Uncharacterized protein n=1 Tax=Euplotes crassus TaxID=5936 RepID=A0AAD1UR33_EUPCR|nr:unnamed protein product [Moneuplotes crassus]
MSKEYILNSALKGKSKKRKSSCGFGLPKMVRIVDPEPYFQSSRSSSADSHGKENNNKERLQKGIKNKVYADQPSDLLEGISDMFVYADLSCNFAKNNKKIGWDVLSNSILNKLHPGNAIFTQQLSKMKLAKENFNIETKEKKVRRKSKTLASKSSFSTNKIPDLSTLNECQSGIAKEVCKLNDNFKKTTENFHNMPCKEKTLKRPAGGRIYGHIKSRYKLALAKVRNGKDTKKRLRRFTRNGRRVRPSSACSSPTKLGRSYDSIQDAQCSEVDDTFTITKIGVDEHVPMREVRDYSNIGGNTSQNQICNTTTKSQEKGSLKRRNLAKFYPQNSALQKPKSQTEKKRRIRRRLKSVGGKRLEFDYSTLVKRKNQPYSYFQSYI